MASYYITLNFLHFQFIIVKETAQFSIGTVPRTVLDSAH